MVVHLGVDLSISPDFRRGMGRVEMGAVDIRNTFGEKHLADQELS